MPMQQKLYDWLAKQWQSIFDNINIETQPAWEMMVEYVLGNREYRCVLAARFDPSTSQVTRVEANP